MDDIKYLKEQTSALINLYNAKIFDEVVRKGKLLIKKFPNQILFYNATSLSLSSLGKNEEALKILDKGLSIQPNNIHILNNLGLINTNLNQLKMAREYYNKALLINENFVDALVNLAQLSLKENKSEETKKYLDKALKLSKSIEQEEIINISLGFYYQQIGNFQESIKCFEMVNKLNPFNTVSDKAISLIHKYQKDDDPHLKQMENKINKIQGDNRQSLYFALGKAYEDIKEYKKSFDFLKLGNDIADRKFNYNISNDEKLFLNIKKLFNNFKRNSDEISNEKIIFITGMPRSGTTLAEQIISAHKEVYGAGELSFLEESIRKNILIDNEFIKKNIDQISYACLKNIENEYINQTGLFNRKEKIWTDKAPLNFRWIGLIKIIFPKAKIIHCKRDAMDVCFSNFKNTFTSKSISFCYNLNKLGKYYKLYEDLMIFWNDIFKDEIYNLSYEKLINNQETETKKLIEYCGLKWDSNCLNPHKNKKIVATASLAQVRSPIYKTSVLKWKNYSSELSELQKMIAES